MNTGFYVAAARRDDMRAIATVLAALPGSIAENLRAALEHHPQVFTGMRHDAERRCAYYVRANAAYLEVYTLPSCSFEEAAEMYAVLDRAEPSVNRKTVKAAYTEVTGKDVQYVH